MRDSHAPRHAHGIREKPMRGRMLFIRMRLGHAPGPCARAWARARAAIWDGGIKWVCCQTYDSFPGFHRGLRYLGNRFLGSSKNIRRSKRKGDQIDRRIHASSLFISVYPQMHACSISMAPFKNSGWHANVADGRNRVNPVDVHECICGYTEMNKELA